MIQFVAFAIIALGSVVSISIQWSERLGMPLWLQNAEPFLTTFVILAISGSAVAIGFLKKLAKYFDARADAYEETLDEMRHRIDSLLAKQEKQVLVIIDDLDRLTTDELLLVFKLVRSNARFKNVLYFLLFDNEKVKDMLKCAGVGSEYIDKIVQVGFHLPAVEPEGLRTLVTESLEGDSLFGSAVDSGFLEEEGFQQAVWQFSLSYLTDLRKVNRFLSSLSFSAARYKTDIGFETSPRDLFLLELLRLHEEEVYRRLYESKSYLAMRPDIAVLISPDRQEDSPRERWADGIRETSKKPDVVEKIIGHLFPDSPFGDMYPRESMVERTKYKRASHPNYFDAYFRLRSPEKPPSDQEFEELLEHSGDAEKFKDVLRSYEKAGRLRSVLESLEARREELSEENSSSVLITLSDLLDGWGSDRRPGSRYAYVESIWEHLLEKKTPEAERADLLRQTLEQSDGIHLIMRVIITQQERINVGVPALLSDEDLKALRLKWVSKVEEIAASGSDLLENFRLQEIISRWNHWGDARGVRVWIRSRIRDPKTRLALLVRFVETDQLRYDRHFRLKLEHLMRYLPSVHWLATYTEDFSSCDHYTEIGLDRIEAIQSDVREEISNTKS